MTIYEIKSPYQVFRDLDGSPLENGKIYIGEVNQNPITHPINIYWDKDFQYPAANPIHIISGSPDRNGSPSNVYCSSPYSMTIYDKNGNLIYNSQSSITEISGDGINHVIDGGFILESYFTTYIDQTYWASWVFDSGLGTSQIDVAKNSFDSLQTDVPNNPKYYLTMTTSGIVTSPDYTKLSHCIEDVFSYVGRHLTLSFYAKADVAANMSTSFTVKTLDVDPRITSIGVKKWDITTEWQKFTLSFLMPDNIVVDPYNENTESCLILNFWLGAGFEYAAETNDLDENNGVTFDLTSVKLEIGTIATPFENERFEDVEMRYGRQYERSYQDYSVSPAGQDGYVTELANRVTANAKGFFFLYPKRDENVTVIAYSTNSGTADTIYTTVTGDLNVTLYNLVNKYGLTSIQCSANMTVNDIIQFHFEATNYLTV